MPSGLDTDTKAHPTFRVAPACEEDIPVLVDIYLSAFRDDFDSIMISDSSRECWAKDLCRYTSDPTVCLWKNCQRREDGSEIIAGWALWTRDGDDDDGYGSESCDSLSDTSSEMDWMIEEEESDREDFRMLSRLRVLLDTTAHQEPWLTPNKTTTRPIWHLDVIAVSPDHQRDGVEAQLLEHLLMAADETGSDVSAEVSPGACPLYRGFGFEDRGLVAHTGGVAGKGLDRRAVMVRLPDGQQRLKMGVGQDYY